MVYAIIILITFTKDIGFSIENFNLLIYSSLKIRREFYLFILTAKLNYVYLRIGVKNERQNQKNNSFFT